MKWKKCVLSCNFMVSTYSRLTHHCVELQGPLTMFSVTPIPERNIICPVPRDPARLILIWDKGWCTSLIGKRKGKQNAKCEWFRSLLLGVYHGWAGLFAEEKWTKMHLNCNQHHKRVQNGNEGQLEEGQHICITLPNGVVQYCQATAVNHSQS